MSNSLQFSLCNIWFGRPQEPEHLRCLEWAEFAKLMGNRQEVFLQPIKTISWPRSYDEENPLRKGVEYQEREVLSRFTREFIECVNQNYNSFLIRCDNVQELFKAFH